MRRVIEQGSGWDVCGRWIVERRTGCVCVEGRTRAGRIGCVCVEGWIGCGLVEALCGLIRGQWIDIEGWMCRRWKARVA